MKDFDPSSLKVGDILSIETTAEGKKRKAQIIGIDLPNIELDSNRRLNFRSGRDWFLILDTDRKVDMRPNFLVRSIKII